mmetsp:Transcript_71099/g.129632  ORF Transcript_71099/g.129632 Transcript_71099/m.129632 type:complete len:528 (+) Transcript_71099:90-1673(+)
MTIKLSKAGLAEFAEAKGAEVFTKGEKSPIKRRASSLGPGRSAALETERPGSGDSIRSAGRSIIGATPTGASGRPPAAPKAKAVAKRRSTSGVVAQRRTSSRGSARAGNSTECAAAAAAPATEPEPLLVLDRAVEDARRAELVGALRTVPNFHPGDDPRAMHGRAFATVHAAEETPAPQVLWKSDKKPREGSPDWLTATEYEDTPAVFRQKVQLLAALLCQSRRTLAYTGAGLSVAAGIGMAAVGAKGQGGMGVATAGEPTLAHCMLAELNRQRLLHGWVQQNHDGLPQKAGYRQEEINEIHGSWFDPSNPVVKYSGCLRGDLFEDMEGQAQTADLVMVLGTSLTGLNADQCVTETARRSREGRALGSVIIGPQRTAQDGKASLRIFSTADKVMTELAKQLGLSARALRPGVKRSADIFPKTDRILVPYDRNGVRSTTVKTYWDLSRGQKVRISAHNNLSGARQPNDKGITSKTVGTIVGRDERTCSFTVSIGGTNKKLGLWWLETAMRGGMEHLPLVNVDASELPA